MGRSSTAGRIGDMTSRASTRIARTVPSARHERLVPRVGAWGLGLAVFYAVFVRFYQGAGGTIGLGGSVPAHPDTLQFASYLAGLLILLGGVVSLVLSWPQLRHFPLGLPRIGGRPVPVALLAPLGAAPALLGGLYAIVHGISGWVAKSLDLAGVAQVRIPPDGWDRYDRTAMDVWELVLYEPWFLAMGIALVLSVRQYARDVGLRDVVIRRAARVSFLVVAAGSAVTSWMMLAGHAIVIG